MPAPPAEPAMLDTAQKGILFASLVPYLGLSAYDGWLHEKARRVPRLEQGLHALLFVSAVALIYGLFAASMRDKVLGSPNIIAWMRRSFAAAFVALGARLALTER